LRKAEVPVEFVVYEDDDHYMHKQRNKIDLFQRVGAFVDKHTQPRKRASAEPQ
jgi:dipeptidyl aminopeptidase/acylaminoacyl peptidase